MLDQVMSIRLTKDLHEALKVIGEAEDRTLQQLVRMAIKRFVDDRMPRKEEE